MTAEHKERLAEGRRQAKQVRQYLLALEENKTRRGRKRTPESLEQRIEALNEQIETADDPLRRLQLIADRERAQAELDDMSAAAEIDLTETEEEFVEVAADYAERRSISYDAFRSVGVPAAVLRRAGIRR